MKGLAAYGVRGDSAAMGVQRDEGGDLMLATIRAQNADYAFYGGLGLDADGTWRDVMRGVVATSAARPTIGTLNGRRAASFNNQWLQTAAFAAEIVQPIAIVAVHDYGTPGVNLFVHDGITDTKRSYLFYQNTTKYIVAGAASSIASSLSTTEPVATMAIYNGTSSQLYANGVLIASGDAGAQSLSGLTIGARFFGGVVSNFFSGPIALIVPVSGANYAARAAAIANAARRWYGTG